jgi:hypothetical protein
MYSCMQMNLYIDAELHIGRIHTNIDTSRVSGSLQGAGKWYVVIEDHRP